jgi:hypothetical protein
MARGRLAMSAEGLAGASLEIGMSYDTAKSRQVRACTRWPAAPPAYPMMARSVGVAHQHVVMTPGQLAVIERARRTPARIVEIERTRRGTAYRNMMKRYSAKAALERERVPISFANQRGKGRERSACVFSSQ